MSDGHQEERLVGQYKNAGQQWHRQGEPVAVQTHDFPDQELGKAIPYGIYDLAANTGWVSVGTDHDTAAFAVACLCRWWESVGQNSYPRSRRLLITAGHDLTPEAGPSFPRFEFISESGPHHWVVAVAG